MVTSLMIKLAMCENNTRIQVVLTLDHKVS